MNRVSTGPRVGHNLTISDLRLGTSAHVSCVGKGRKQRITPLTITTVRVLKDWLAEHAGALVDPVFPTRRATALSRDALARLVARHTAAAPTVCPTIFSKNVTPHTLRHTAAMRLLPAGIDSTVLALWLGHASTNTVQIYIHADLALKEHALARTAPLDAPPGRYQPDDTVLAFLNTL
jgi:integrase/recombinase XerD